MRATHLASSVEPLEPRTLFAAPPAGPGDTLPNISDTATDAAGNVVRAGTFTGTVDFDPADAAFNLTAQSTDNYVAKFAPDGALLWAVRFGAPQTMGAPKLDVSRRGDVYVSAAYGAAFDADPSDSGTTTLDLRGGQHNLYLIRLDPDGRFVRANAFATPLQAMAATDVAVAPDGRVVLAASSLVPGAATAADQNGDAHYYLLTARLRTTVHHRWATTTPTGVVAATSMILGPSGETYIAGATASGVDFAPGRHVRRLFGPALDNPFLLRINPAGGFDWVLGFEFPAGITAPTIQVNRADDTTVDVSGDYTSNLVDFNPSRRKQWFLTGRGNTYAAVFTSLGALIFAEDTSPPLPPT